MRKLFLSTFILSSLIAGNVLAKEGNTQFVLNYDAKLEKEFKENYGIREKEIIQEILADEVDKVFGNSNYKIEFNLINVIPNRPTLQQMADKMGLSYDSFGIGGANISGKVYDMNGKLIAESKFDYSNPSIFDARNTWTWHDAEWALERFVNKLSAATK